MTVRFFLASLLAVVAACTAQSEESTTSSQATTTSTSVEATPTDPGRLVVLDSAGDIVIVNPDGADQHAVTDDAGESAAYTQPIWSPDGESLAWGQVTDAGFAIGVEDVSTGETTAVPTTNLPFYMSWSSDGTRLGVLHNGTTGVVFGLLDVPAADFERLDEDAPFYFSWDPAGEDLITHAGASRVDRVDRSGETTSLEPTSASYLAPHWTTSGTFHASEDSIVLETADGRGDVARINGLAMFVANDQGTKVAIQTSGVNAVSVALADPPAIPGGRVVVVDLSTGEAETVSNELALGFFWSPDGESLLVVTPTGEAVTPTVWSSDGSSQDFDGYRPAPTMLQDTFPFFPQYAQSVRFWSPDSSAFAYAGEVDGEQGVWVQQLSEEAPVMVSDGRWVAWSPARSGE